MSATFELTIKSVQEWIFGQYQVSQWWCNKMALCMWEKPFDLIIYVSDLSTFDNKYYFNS